MSRKMRLVSLCATLVVLIVASVVVKNMENESETYVEEDTSVVALSIDMSTLTEFSWNYNDEEIALAKSGEEWVYATDNTFPLNTTYVDMMLTVLEEIKATKTIESPEDLSEYGLDEPKLTIKAKADRDIEINVGNKSNMDGEKYITTGDGNVYIVDSSILTTFSYGLYDIVQKEAIPTMSDMNSLTIERGLGTLNILYADDTDWAYSAEYVWFLTEGEEHTALDTELTGTLTDLITGLSWSKCIDYNASEEKLAEYGLDNPAAVVTVDYMQDINVATDETDEDGNVIYETKEESRTFVLEIGNIADSYAYAKISGSSMVYMIPSSTAETFMYTTSDELLPDEILYMDWDLVDSVDITLDGETYHVEKQVNEETDDEGNVTQETVYVLNGEEIDIIEIFDDMTSLVSTGSVGGAVEATNVEIGFVFNRSTESFKQVELIFYQHDSTSCLVSLNGEKRLLIARSDVASLIEDISAVIK